MLNLIGINRDCNRTTLGVDRIFFISGARVESLNFDRLDRITAITTAEGESWLEAAFQPGDALFDQTQTRDGAWMKTTQRVTLNYSNVYSGILRAVRRLGDASRLHMIVLTIDGRAYYCGVNFWPERGYEWETTNFGVSGGNTTAGSPEAGAGMTIELEAVGRNYAPIVVANLADLPVADLPPADLDPDDTPPFVIDEFPADGITGVSITPGFFRLFFNEPVKWDGSAAQIQLVETGVGVVKTWTIGTSPGILFDQAAQTITISQGIPTLSYSTAYHILFTSGVEDLSGNDWAGFSASTDWNFTTEAAPSTTVLAISSLSPADNSTTVDPSGVTSLQITYDSDAAPGAGNVVLWRDNGGGSYTIIGIYDVNGPNVSFAGDTVTVTIGSVLASETDYFVQITPGAVVSDESGIAHAGITDTTTWNFTTIDTGPPSYVSFSPDVATEDNSYSPTSISFTASENLAKNSGNILIKDWDDDSTLYTVAVTDASVSISGAIVTIDLSDMPAVDGSAAAILPPLKRVYIQMAAGTFQDTSGNNLPALAKATGDVWNFTTEKPPLQLTIEPVTGSGAQTIAGEFTGHSGGGVVVIEWEAGTFTRYEVATGLNTLSTTYGVESLTNVNVFFIGASSTTVADYEVHTAYFESESFIKGISFPGGETIGTFNVTDLANLEYLSNIGATDFPDSLTVDNPGAWTGEEIDFDASGGGVGTYVVFQNVDNLTLTLASVSGFPTFSFVVSTCDNLDFSLGSLVFNPATALSIYFDNNTLTDDGVVANQFVTELFQRLDSNSAGTSGGYLDLSAMQIDYTTGTAAADAWRSMWEIFNLPASVSSWAFSFDPSSGPLSVVETLDTSVTHTIESVGLPIGVMIGNTESGIYSIHDYTASGTARTTQTQTGMTSSAKKVWMAWYFADGQDISAFTEIPFDTDTTKNFAVYTSIGTATSGQRRIMDLGDGSVLQTDDGNNSFATKSRTVTPTDSVFNCRSILEFAAATTLHFQDTVGAVTGDLDLTPAGLLIESFRIENASLTSLNLAKAQLDAIKDIRLVNPGGSFSESWDISDNIVLDYLQLVQVTGLDLIVDSTSGHYPDITTLTLSNSVFVNGVNWTGFDQATQLIAANLQAVTGNHTIPSSMPNVSLISIPGTVDINTLSLELDNYPNLRTADLRSGFLASISLSTPPHTRIFNLLLNPATTWSQSNTLDLSEEDDLRTLNIGGSGSIGPIIPPGVGFAAIFRDLLVNGLMDSADVDDLVDYIYDIRAENPATGKLLQIIPGSGSVSSTQVDKINGTGAYSGDGLVDNGWTVTYV